MALIGIVIKERKILYEKIKETIGDELGGNDSRISYEHNCFCRS